MENQTEFPPRRETDPPVPTVAYRCKNFFRYHYDGVIVFLTPFILTPLLFMDPPQEFYCLYVLLMVAIYWMTESLPLFVTSLIPVVAYPLMGILSGPAVADVFFNVTTMEIWCGLVLGLAFELSNLHQRIALGTMMIFGFSPKRFHFGVLIGTMFLSMWMPNENTAHTICPIIKVLFDELARHGMVQLYSNKKPQNLGKPLYPSHTMMFYYLSVVYATTIGSCGTLIGTGSNLTIKGLFETRFPRFEEITYVSFMLFSSPIMLVQIVFLFLWLQIVHMGLLCPHGNAAKDFNFGKEGEQILRTIITQKYKELGAVSLFEIQVIFLFLLINALMFSCHVRKSVGWCDRLHVRDHKASTVFLFGILLFFLIPHNYRFVRYLIGKRPAQEMPERALLVWQDIQDNIQWGRILLFGGGFVLAKGVHESGLSKLIGQFLDFVEPWPHPCLQLCCILIGAFLTVFSSNIAVCTILVAILAEVSAVIGIHPLYVTLPTALACGLAFLLPISTKMNAEVANFANIPATNMAIMGIGPTIISVIILFVASQTWIHIVFPDISRIPKCVTLFTDPMAEALDLEAVPKEASKGVGFRMKNFCALNWRGMLSVVIPLAFSPILLLTPTLQFRCLYIVVIMALFWIAEIIPLYMTSLIPIVAFPVLGVLDSISVCETYFNNALILFFAGVSVALAIEYSNLHNRIALGVIMVVGCSPRRLHLGLICTATFMSMWIPNTATTAMFCPVIKAVLAQLSGLGIIQLTTAQPVEEDEPPFPSKTVLCYYLGVAYAATIGGCGSLIGTGTNLTFKGIYETRFPTATDISFLNFFLFGAPPMVLQAICLYFWLQFLYQGWLRPKSQEAIEVEAAKQNQADVKDFIARKYRALGPMTAHELQVAILFVLMIALLFLRKPGIFPGYSNLLHEKKVKGSVPITLIIILLFVLPVRYTFLRYLIGKRPEEEKPLGSLLGWKFVHDHMPWGLMFLLGGGFALAKGLHSSGLSVMIGQEMSSLLKPLPVPLIQFLCIFLAVFMTAFSANVAICNIIVPVLCELAVASKLHPLYLVFPAGLGCSLAFHLPVSTPPNALVAGFVDIRSKQMAIGGIGPSICCILILFLASQTWMFIIFPQVATFPEWAKAKA